MNKKIISTAAMLGLLRYARSPLPCAIVCIETALVFVGHAARMPWPSARTALEHLTLNLTKMKTWYLVHKWTSLICTVFLLMLCLTGLPLIFWHEIEHLTGGEVEPAVMPADAPRMSLDAIAADAEARRPADAVQYVSKDDDEPNVWGVGLGETADAEELTVFYTYDARTGALLDT
jgi:hypothetical protein